MLRITHIPQRQDPGHKEFMLSSSSHLHKVPSAPAPLLHGYTNTHRTHTAPHATHSEYKRSQNDICCSVANEMPNKTINKAIEIETRNGKGGLAERRWCCRERVAKGGCIRKGTQYQEDESEGKQSWLMGERCRNWRGDLKIKKKKNREMPAEEREAKMRPWSTMLPAATTGFDHWPFSYSHRCWIILGVSVFWFLIKKSFWPSLVIV